MPKQQYLTNQNLLKETDIFLASYPRSGNTWMRLLLSDAILQLQGFQTTTGGNIIPDIYKVSINEWNNHMSTKLNFRIIKTHEPLIFEQVLELKNRVFYLFRKPADCLCSYYYYLLRHRKHRENGKGIDELCLERLEKWCSHVTNYINYKQKSPESIIFLSYEKLSYNPVEVLNYVMELLGWKNCQLICQKSVENQEFNKLKSLSKEEKPEKMGFSENHGYQDFFRKGKVNSSQEELSSETLRIIEEKAMPIYRKASSLEPIFPFEFSGEIWVRQLQQQTQQRREWKIAHIINPVLANESSDLYIAQPITFATMKTAQKQAEGKVDVILYTTSYPEDHAIIPEGFIKTPDLERSILDITQFQVPRKLPLIKDILDRLYQTAVDADYLIYTNADIALQPHFYTEVAKIIEQGYDAFVINRRTIPEHYQNISEIPQMYAEQGKPHEGHDCFIFKRSLYEKFYLENHSIGVMYCFRPVFLNCLCRAEKFQEFRDLHLTFHIGDQKSWRDSKLQDYIDHNKSDAQKVFDAYFSQKLLPNHPLIEGMFSEFLDNATRLKLSIVFSGRNDSYGNNFKERVIAAWKRNHTEMLKRGIRAEWIFVEWNPLNKDYFSYTLAPLGFKCYVVSPQIHEKICTNPNMTFLQFFAKNVGMRRASNDWILATNADVVFGNDVLNFISENKLEHQIIYRAERRDIKPGLYEKTFYQMRSNTVRHYKVDSIRKKFGYAAGDFTLYHKDTVDFGYDESITGTDVRPDARFIANFIAKNNITDYESHLKFIGTVFKEDHPMTWMNTRNLKNNHKGYDKAEYVSENLPYQSSPNWGLTDYNCLEIGKNVWKIGRVKLAHIINPVLVNESSDLYIAQPITFATMKTAQQQAAGKVDVAIYTAQYPEDHTIIPEGFIKTPDLDRSILDMAQFQISRKLPIIKDILDRLYQVAVDADYLIYTNVDIALQPHFYTEVAKIIEQGYDAFSITRRTIPDHYQNISEIPQMYLDKGEPHPGQDCFVFKRSLYEKFYLEKHVLGALYSFRPIALNLLCHGEKFEIFRDLYLTFHIGDPRTWNDSKQEDYLNHNKNEAKKVFEYYLNQNLVPNHPLIRIMCSGLINPKPLVDEAFKAEIIAPETLVVSPGEKVEIQVTVKNISREVWPTGYISQIKLGSCWLDENGEKIKEYQGRTVLPQLLQPTESIDLPLTITIPETPGNYLLELDMLQEGVTWFGQKGSHTTRVKVEVNSRENYLSSKTFVFVTGVEGSGTTMLLKVLDNLEECVAMGGNYFPQYVSDSAKQLNSLTNKLWSYPPPTLKLS